MTRRFVLGAAGVSLVWWRCSRIRATGKAKVKWRVIEYTEPDGVFDLYWEPIMGGQPIAYVPSPRRWREDMPEWAQDRRDEIFPEIKRQTEFMEFNWREFD